MDAYSLSIFSTSGTFAAARKSLLVRTSYTIIVMREIHAYLAKAGIFIYASEAGEFCTSQEMAGVSITLIKLDDEIKKYYDMAADSPGYMKFSKVL